MTLKATRIVFLAAVFVWTLAPGAHPQDNVIDQRIKLMKENSADNKAVKAAFAKGDYATVETKAMEIVGNFDKLADLFPKGSTADNSRAKPEIWQNWDDFKAKLISARSAAKELAEAAGTKNQEKVGPAFVAFGKTCGSCHKPYRAPRN